MRKKSRFYKKLTVYDKSRKNAAALKGKKDALKTCPVAKKSEQAYKAYSDLVRWKGFEPPTFWFVAKHSIQLSYQRVFM